MNPKNGNALEAFLLLLAFIVANLLGARYQKQISFQNGKGWEGVAYVQVAEQLAAHQPLRAEAPMVYRVGTPFLVSRISPNDPIQGFRIVNLLANGLTVALLIVWLRLYLPDWRIRTLLGLMFVLQWDTPVRWLWFYPAHTDPWLWVFLLGGLIALHHLRDASSPLTLRRWMLGLSLISFVGVLFREVALVIPISLLFLYNPVVRVDGILGTFKSAYRPQPAFFVPLLWGGLALFLLKRMAVPTEAFSFYGMARHWAYAKPVLTYIHGIFLAYGPVLFLLLYRWRSALRFLGQHQFLGVYLAFFAVMGYLGGTDTERLLYWSMPVVFILLGRAMEECKPLLKPAAVPLALGAAQLLASRAVMLTPDYTEGRVSNSIPLLTPFGKNTYFMDLFSFHGTPMVEFISFLEYLMLGVALIEWMNYVQRLHSPQEFSLPPKKEQEDQLFAVAHRRSPQKKEKVSRF